MSTHFRSIDVLRKRLDHMSPDQVKAAYARLLDGLDTLRRFDITYVEAGCDCCSGSIEREEDLSGEYVVDLHEVLALAEVDGKDAGDNEAGQRELTLYTVSYKYTGQFASPREVILYRGLNETEALAAQHAHNAGVAYMNHGPAKLQRVGIAA